MAHSRPKVPVKDCDMPPVEPQDARLVRIIYVWLSLGAAGALLAAKLNVVWHDPWCTPRLRPYFLLYWGVARVLFPFLLLLTPVGVVSLVISRDMQRRWEMWLAVFLLLLAIYHVLNT
jgi:hypothetical protein